MQWEVIRRAFNGCLEVYIAGDDDQAIYKWSGADVDSFLSLEGEREVLAKSWRLPSSIHKLSQKIIKRVDKRFDKAFASREDIGNISYYLNPGMIEDAEGTWLYLARNAYQLSGIKRTLFEQGITFTTSQGSSVKTKEHKAIVYWERLRAGKPQLGVDARTVLQFLEVGVGIKRGFKDGKTIVDDVYYKMSGLMKDHGILLDVPWHEALTGIPLEQREYYLAILRRGGPKALSQQPRHHVSTIHGVKGGEADNVVLFTDLAKKSYAEYSKNPDDEIRVFYVGVTRAREHLHIVLPQTNMYFNEYR